MKEQFLLAAQHESGHVVKNFIDGARLSVVSICMSGEGTTITNHPLFKTLHLITWESPVMKSFVNCHLAGAACELFHENKLSTGTLPLHCYDDVSVAMHYMKSRGWKQPTGYKEVDFFRDYGGAAKYFAIAYSKEVSLFADELVKNKEMSGFECAKFLEGVFKSLPPKALPHAEHRR